MGNTQKKAAQQPSKDLHTLGASVKKVHWNGPGLPSPPGKPHLIPGEEDSQPDVVGIYWERSPSNGGSAIIGYHVEHRKMGSPNWLRSAPVLCTFPELTLSGLEPGWRYQFRIRAQNALGLSEPSELSDPLTVTLQRAVSIAPRLDTELKDCVVIEGQKAEFSVSYTGIPTPKISWFKDGFEIFSSRRTTIATNNKKSVLIVHKTLIEDEGEIKCSATNRTGHISTRANLTIEAPPYIKLPRQYADGLLFERGEMIRLKVINGGRPPPSITWYHNNEIIIVDQRHNFESITNNETILKIEDAKRQDRGEYSIRAINKLGEDVTCFLVTVTDRPTAPQKIQVTEILGRSVTLMWEEPIDDGGCKIGTYIVEYYKVGWDVWLKAVNCRKTIAILNDLIVGSEYRFRVKAENPFGFSDPSEESDTVFIPDLIRGINQPNIRIKSSSHQDIPRQNFDRYNLNFNESNHRAQSLNHEEIQYCGSLIRNECTNCLYKFGSSENTSNAIPADNWALLSSSIIDFEKNEIHKQKLSKIRFQPKKLKIMGTSTLFKTAIVITPNLNESKAQKSLLESQSRFVSPFHTYSPTKKSMERLSEIVSNEGIVSYESDASLSKNIQQKRSNIIDIQDKNMSLRMIQSDDEENMLHNSSEFMLVLYPNEENNEQSTTKRTKIGSRSQQERTHSIQKLPRSHFTIEHRIHDVEPEYLEQEYFNLPSMSFSLPNLFSTRYQIVEILRKAVSSSELLHEHAKKKFYRAIEIEKSKKKLDQFQIKFQASDLNEQTLSSGKCKNYKSSPFNSRIKIRRCLLNSETNSATWLMKRDRRRSSEGQTKIPNIKVPNVFITVPLENASSDPNLLISNEMLPQNVEPNSELGGSIELLRRWHEPGVDLSNEQFIAEMIDKEENTQIKEKEELYKLPNLNEEGSRFGKNYNEFTSETREILAEDSVDTSSISSENESTDSENLKQLKSRIMAIPTSDEEDRRGRRIMHVDTETPPLIPPHGIPVQNVSRHIPNKMNVSPINSIKISSNKIQPKSILKKHTESEYLSFQSSRCIPPEKPIRKSLPIYDDFNSVLHNSKSTSDLEYSSTDKNILLNKSISRLIPEITPINIIDIDLDKEAVISAGEAAVIKRKQMKRGSNIILSTEDNEDEEEEKMAVVSHYTELVQQYSNSGIRQSSLSQNLEQKSENIHLNSYEDTKSTMTRITTSISPISLIKSKIITPIPPVIPSIPIQKAKPIHPTEYNSRYRSLSNKLNTIETSILRGRSREKMIDNESETAKKCIVEDSRNSIFTEKKDECHPTTISDNRSTSSSAIVYKSRNTLQNWKKIITETEPLSITRDDSASSSSITTSNNIRSSRSLFKLTSQDCSRANTLLKMQIEYLQPALWNKKDRLIRTSTKDDITTEETLLLAIKTERKVRTTINYIIDVVLLLAAMYVYLFKKEILAIPIIGLLFYRYIQQEIRNWIPPWSN